MIAFLVADMTCQHCVASITRAVQSVDPAARVEVDLAAHRVTIDPSRPATDGRAFATAISDAGFSPRQADGADA